MKGMLLCVFLLLVGIYCYLIHRRYLRRKSSEKAIPISEIATPTPVDFSNLADLTPESLKRLRNAIYYPGITNVPPGLYCVEFQVKNTKNYADNTMMAVFDCWESACAFRALLEYFMVFRLKVDGKESPTRLVIMKTKIRKYRLPELDSSSEGD